MNILSSASKLVLLIVTLTLSAGFLFLVFTGKITIDPKDFMSLVLMVFAYYFGQKQQLPSTPQTTQQ